MKLWIARDRDMRLYVYRYEPFLDFGDWDSIGDCMQLPISAFPEVTFENSPQKVELKLIEK